MSLDRSRLDYRDEATHAMLHDRTRGLDGYAAAPQRIFGIVCIGCWGRSGSGLMSSMLDNHPDLVQIYPQHALVAIYDEVLPGVGEAQAVEDVVNAVLERFAQVKGHPTGWTSLTEDRAGAFSEVLAFHLEALQQAGQFCPRTVFLAIHGAYAHAMGCQPRTAMPMIVFQSHSNGFELRQRIRRDFPEARFVVMGRYPPRALDSALLAYSEVLPQAFPDDHEKFFHWNPFMIPMRMVIYMGEMGRRTTRDEDIVAVRFEDLHMRTRETMTWLAGWLGIAWHEALMESTLRGEAWGKHSVYGAKYNVGTRQLTWEDYRTACQSRIDLLKFRAYQDEFIRVWDYDAPPLSAPVRFLALNVLSWWPMRLHWRMLRAYLRNPRGKSRVAIVGEFGRRWLELAREMRAEYRRQTAPQNHHPVVARAAVDAPRWPGPEIEVGRPAR